MVLSAQNRMEGNSYTQAISETFGGIQERDELAARNAAAGKADSMLFASTPSSFSAWIVKLELKCFLFFLRGSLSGNSHRVSKNQSDFHKTQPFSCLVSTILFVHCVAVISTWKCLLYLANA